nr:Rho termination factor N-terminal domain-containing protein [Chitinophagales bacterium]
MQYDILQLNEMLVNELRDVAENLNVSNYRKLNKQALIFKILDHQTATGTIINQNTAILSPPPPSTTDTQ